MAETAGLVRRGGAGSTPADDVGRTLADLEISRAWLVDPAAGREGPGDVVVEDGIVRSVVWLDGAPARARRPARGSRDRMNR